MFRCEWWRIDHLTPLLVVTMPYACWFLWRSSKIQKCHSSPWIQLCTQLDRPSFKHLVPRLSLVLLSLLTRLCSEKPRSQTTSPSWGSQVWFAIATLELANSSWTPSHWHKKSKICAYLGVHKLKITSPRNLAIPQCIDWQAHCSKGNVSPTGSVIARLMSLCPIHLRDNASG